jgi:hypothetical protein
MFPGTVPAIHLLRVELVGIKYESVKIGLGLGLGHVIFLVLPDFVRVSQLPGPDLFFIFFLVPLTTTLFTIGKPFILPPSVNGKVFKRFGTEASWTCLHIFTPYKRPRSTESARKCQRTQA